MAKQVRGRRRDVVVIGASAGGVEALRALVASLPADFPASVLMVLHVSASESVLPQILARAGKLPVVHAKTGMPLEKGRIYVAPPDRHLVVEKDALLLTRGPRENGHRPAVDVLFRSAALAHGPRVIGVVLTGFGSCGTAGLWSIKHRGGVAVVQDPATAAAPQMPRSALDNVRVDHCVPLEEIGELLTGLVEEPIPNLKRKRSKTIEHDVAMARADVESLESDARPGEPSEFACPDCGGVLWHRAEDGTMRFRCRVGHAYALESLATSQSDAMEYALWSALRAMEENASVLRRMANRARLNGNSQSAQRFEESAWNKQKSAVLIRNLLLGGTPDSPVKGTEEKSRTR